jgi:hypothetical protein
MVLESDKQHTIIGILLALLSVAQEENLPIGPLDTGAKASPFEECKAGW